MFKADWEKTSVTSQLPEGMVEKMVRLAYPDKKLISHELITGGCANLNIKIVVEDEKHPLILRVYLRDKDASYREQKLAALLKQTIPVPLTYYIGELEDYHFAITEFMPGMPLRDLLLGDAPHYLSTIMHELGAILSKIAAHEFSRTGFFDKQLNVIPYESSDVIKFAQDCLGYKTVLAALTPEVISEILKVFEQYGHLFPDENGKHLVHGDFDPANILVEKVNGLWVVSGILDWEFSFSGSVLWDVANMLRYAHKMPPEFESSFIEALEKNGIKLEHTWRTAIHLLNLSSLLDCLKRADFQNNPNQCADIFELIQHILSELNFMKKTDPIEVVPYDPNWPNIFETEAAKIKQALGNNCIAIHHVGSTSVPGLAAKPIIDIVPVVRDILALDQNTRVMEALGYEAKGEYGMLFRRYFQKKGFNVHIFEQTSAEIDGHLLFRNWMREHRDDREHYAKLKQDLALRYPNDIYQYVFGKDAFVKNIHSKTGFNGLRVVKALTPREWASAKHFRDTYFFGPHGIDDPYTWTFDHCEHTHLILYQGTEIIGYAHIQFWTDRRAAIRIIAIDEGTRRKNAGSTFLVLIEKWLKNLGVKSIHAESRQSSLKFYLKNSYVDMPFGDPEGHESDPNDVPVGKVL
ncbi:TPA: GNAT family N-acetyltransferase [Legionella pneumophila]|nr:GNAT family N-acetyltransferase [Legionella pneumophila]HCJ1102230.1 GNAT family N-acetyltransferase [Legionella pneumophila]HCJ1111445.1 GNAT family N-acetyltransferase [Legionella pneumophila]HCU6013098.1 GNAT family N-acetyltransferase [Legionella pneumophila]